MWKLLASTRVTSTGASRRPFTAASPPNPAPTTTTRFRHDAPGGDRRRRPRRPPGSCSRPGPGWRGCSSPTVTSPIRPSTNGVTAAPEMLLASASPRAATRTSSRSAASSASASGIGTVRRMPVAGRARWASTSATTAADSTRWGTGRPGRAGVEGREPVVPPAEHRHAGHLEVLERAGQVEEGLGAGAHRDQRVVGDGVEVGGDVTGGLGVAVDAADAPGREHADPGGGGQGERAGHGGGAVLPAHGDGHAQVALGRLAGRTADPGVLGGVDAHPRHPVQHRRHGRHATAGPDHGQAPLERLAVGRGRAARGARRSSTRAPRPARRRPARPPPRARRGA